MKVGLANKRGKTLIVNMSAKDVWFLLRLCWLHDKAPHEEFEKILMELTKNG